MRWAIVTGVYPPDRGGVADHTFLLAQELARQGDEVHVFAPRPARALPGVRWHRLRHWRADWSAVPAPFQALVAYTPQSFGWSGMNLPFGRWLRRQRRLQPWVMFHEVAYPREAGQGWKLRCLALATARLARDARRAAARSLIAIPAWDEMLQQLAPGAANEWMPVCSNLPVGVPAAASQAARRRLLAAGGRHIVAHFGRHHGFMGDAVGQAFTALLQAPEPPALVLAGGDGAALRDRIRAAAPRHAARVQTTGYLEADALAAHLAAADALVQPYPDGVSTRRGTLLAGLALGRATVTNLGHLSEPLWAETEAVQLAPLAAPGPLGSALAAAVEALLADDAAREALGARGAELYRSRFTIECTVEQLRRPFLDANPASRH